MRSLVVSTKHTNVGELFILLLYLCFLFFLLHTPLSSHVVQYYFCAFNNVPPKVQKCYGHFRSIFMGDLIIVKVMLAGAGSPNHIEVT